MRRGHLICRKSQRDANTFQNRRALHGRARHRCTATCGHTRSRRRSPSCACLSHSEMRDPSPARSVDLFHSRKTGGCLSGFHPAIVCRSLETARRGDSAPPREPCARRLLATQTAPEQVRARTAPAISAGSRFADLPRRPRATPRSVTSRLRRRGKNRGSPRCVPRSARQQAHYECPKSKTHPAQA
jgi:hypothetical protein